MKSFASFNSLIKSKKNSSPDLKYFVSAEQAIADGADEEAAVDALVKLVESGFAE